MKPVRAIGRRLPFLEQLPPAIELLVDPFEVPTHRGARASCVGRLERLQDGAMVPQCRGAQLGRLEVVLHSPPDGPATAIPKVVNNGHESTVVCGGGDSQMKVAVCGIRVEILPLTALHLFHGATDRSEIFRAGVSSRLCRDLTLDQPSSAQEFEGSLSFALWIGHDDRSRRRYVNTCPDANLDLSRDLESDQGFAYGRARNTEQHCKLPF